MKKAIKFFYKYVDILMVVCLLSVGYSSWSIPVLGTASTNLQFQTYPVFKSDVYVELVEDEITYFDYCDQGFIVKNPITVEDGNATIGTSYVLTGDKGSITIPVTIKSACYDESSLFATKGGMELNVIITFTNSSSDEYFLQYCDVTASVTSSDGAVFDLGSPYVDPIEGSVINLIQTIDLNYADNINAQTPGSFTITVNLNVEERTDKDLEDIFALLPGTSISIQATVQDIPVA